MADEKVILIPYHRGLLAKYHGIHPDAKSFPCGGEGNCWHCPNDPEPLWPGEHVFLEGKAA